MSRVFTIAAVAALLAACGPDMTPGEEEVVAPRTPRIEARAADTYGDLGGRVVDLVLIPNEQPFLGRALAALDGGGYAVIDFAEGAVGRIDAPSTQFLIAAPGFQLRGSPAPLVIAAGGALASPQASVFLPLDGELIPMPMDPVAPDGPIRAMCAERVTEALVDLVIFTDTAMELWRVRDRGGDQLTAERVETTPITDATVSCTALNGEVVAVSDDGRTRVIGQTRWGLQDGVDVAGLERADGWWTIVARPDAAGASLIDPYAAEIEVAFAAGLNTPATTTPAQLTASAANFGGSFGDGLVAVSQGDRVNVVELGGLISEAKRALTNGS
jgi:hypothetical protein